jgi:signal transduction histidine kinase
LLFLQGIAYRRAEAERARTAEFRERFMAILGHDLRNPLASIATTVQVLQRTTGPEQANALKRIEVSGARMGRMIDQLLDLARIRLGGGIRLEPEAADLGKIVDDIADELRRSQPEGAIQVEEHERTDGCWDVDRLGQVISNLIGNALAYRAPDTPVRASVQPQGEAALLTVHNDGPPIPRAVLPAIFDPFRRGDRAGRGAGAGGLGLGLFITKELVAAHGGTVEVQSTEQAGTTFTVRLPRHNAR